MNHIAGVVKMHARNKLAWFFLPWFILLLSLAVNLFIGFLLGGKTEIFTGGLSSIYIFMLILGPISLRDTFAFALGFSVRRMDYLLGTVLMVLATSAVTALLLFLLSLLESTLIVGWGVGVHFFHLPYLNNGSLFEQFWVYFVPLVCLYFLGFVIGCIYRRFGSTGMWIFFSLAVLLVSAFTLIYTYLRWWGTLFTWLGQFSAFEFALWMAPLSTVYVLVSYVLLRKATV